METEVKHGTRYYLVITDVNNKGDIKVVNCDCRPSVVAGEVMQDKDIRRVAVFTATPDGGSGNFLGGMEREDNTLNWADNKHAPNGMAYVRDKARDVFKFAVARHDKNDLEAVFELTLAALEALDEGVQSKYWESEKEFSVAIDASTEMLTAEIKNLVRRIALFRAVESASF